LPVRLLYNQQGPRPGSNTAEDVLAGGALAAGGLEHQQTKPLSRVEEAARFHGNAAFVPRRHAGLLDPAFNSRG
jgi:hypothetical protein